MLYKAEVRKLIWTCVTPDLSFLIFQEAVQFVCIFPSKKEFEVDPISKFLLVPLCLRVFVRENFD
jgi:hypothetical protein